MEGSICNAYLVEEASNFVHIILSLMCIQECRKCLVIRHLKKGLGLEACFGPGSTRWALAQPKPERPKPGPSPLKGGPGSGLHFRPGPAQRTSPNHGLLGPPRSPPRSPPRGPPRSPPRGSPRSPFRSPPKSPFIGPPKGPSKSPPKSPSPPCRFFI